MRMTEKVGRLIVIASALLANATAAHAAANLYTPPFYLGSADHPTIAPRAETSRCAIISVDYRRVIETAGTRL